MKKALTTNRDASPRLTGPGLTRLRQVLFARWLQLPSARFPVFAERNLPVPMPDGTHLLADRYTPKTQGNYPTILIRSPWGRGWEAFPFSVIYMFIAHRFAERGYHVVVQSTRSKATDDILPSNEAADGRATLAWLGEQPWFNGSLGLWGQSYLGFVQWAVAKDAPPFLKALLPGMTTAWMRSLFYQKSTFLLEQTLTILSAVNMAHQPFLKLLLNSKRQKRLSDAALAHLPLIEADTIALGVENSGYREVLTHPQLDDPYWQPIDLRSTLPEITVPTHLVGGWYDIFLDDLLGDYTKLYSAGHNPTLTLGPWTHGHPETGWANLREGLRWFETQLKGMPSERTSPVRAYIMGTNVWRDLDHWPPPTRQQRYYLHQQRELSLRIPAEQEEPDQYCYDPADPTPSIGGPLLSAKAGAQDNRVLEQRSDVLCYTTEPLTADVTVMGPVHLTLYISSSAASTDFFGRVCDVFPDGRSINICDGLLRLQPGGGEHQPDGSRRIEIALSSTANCFRAGHRIRLQVSSGAYPRWNRNLGTAEPFASATKMLIASQIIYHDHKHLSHLVLPAEI